MAGESSQVSAYMGEHMQAVDADTATNDDDDAAQSFTYFRPPGMSGILQASERLRRRSENYAQLRKLTDAAEQKSRQMQERR